jgi:predicted porin
MKKFTKTRLASAVGTAALALSLAAPANAAITIGEEDGWKVEYSGFINLFYTHTRYKGDFLTPLGGSRTESDLRDGLLPAFHTFTVHTPTWNGLTGMGQFTFAPTSSGPQDQRLNFGQNIDMREVFFNVSGNFGTISAGRTLALFQRQAILRDYTLFGVGDLGLPGIGGTALGRIGQGYVYPDFRTRFTYKTPEVNGFQAEIGIFDPQKADPFGFGTDGTGLGTKARTPQFQGEVLYTTPFAGPAGHGGDFSAYISGLWQEQKTNFNLGAPF